MHRRTACPAARARAGRQTTRLRGALGALGALALCLLPLVGAQADEIKYRLGPEDRVRLKVFEWRPSQDEIFEWKALNDEFTVSAAGQLSIPLAGAIPVQGLTVDEVAQQVGERLRARMGLSAPPDAAIEIIQYRPFFVSGDVVHPGPYPYHPGLTVLEAVAIAGGVTRAGDLGLMRLGRDVISGEGDLTQIVQESGALLIRRARLQAEINGAESFELPPDLKARRTNPVVLQMMQAETMVFQARQSAFKTQTKALHDLRHFLEREADSVDAQLGIIDTQVGLINKELTNVAALVDKGMAIAPREMALQRSVAQMQGDRLSMQTAKLRVQEEMSKTDIALIQLSNGRTNDASVEFRDTQTKLDALSAKADTTGRLLYESKVTAPQLLADRSRKIAVAPDYVIVRQNQAGSLDALETTAMDAGDTVKVTLSLPDSNEDTSAELSSQEPSLR